MRSALTALAMLAGLVAPARAGETFSPEAFLPSTDGRDAYTPTAAFGKDVFLVAWRSGHLAKGDLREGLKFDAKIVGCRVDKSGKALDAKPFAIAAATDLRESPRVAFGGDTFLVVWQDLRNGKDWDIYASRIASDGVVLDKDGVLVSGGAHNQALPDVAWDGQAFQVVWMDFRSGKQYQTYGARVSKDGKVLDPQGVLLGAGKMAIEQFFGPTVASASTGGKSLVFWMGAHRNRGNPLATCQFVAGGKAAGPPTFTEKSHRKGPGGQHSTFPASMAAGPKGYLLTWTTNVAVSRGSPPRNANAMTFDAEGRSKKYLALAGVWGPPRNFPKLIRNPRSAWDGKTFVTAWGEYDPKAVGRPHGSKRPVETVFATRVTVTGEPGEKIRLSGDYASPAIKATVASDGAGTTLVAYEKHPSKGDIPIKIGFRMLRAK